MHTVGCLGEVVVGCCVCAAHEIESDLITLVQENFVPNLQHGIDLMSVPIPALPTPHDLIDFAWQQPDEASNRWAGRRVVQYGWVQGGDPRKRVWLRRRRVRSAHEHEHVANLQPLALPQLCTCHHAGSFTPDSTGAAHGSAHSTASQTSAQPGQPPNARGERSALTPRRAPLPFRARDGVSASHEVREAQLREHKGELVLAELCFTEDGTSLLTSPTEHVVTACDEL